MATSRNIATFKKIKLKSRKSIKLIVQSTKLFVAVKIININYCY